MKLEYHRTCGWGARRAFEFSRQPTGVKGDDLVEKPISGGVAPDDEESGVVNHGHRVTGDLQVGDRRLHDVRKV